MTVSGFVGTIDGAEHKKFHLVQALHEKVRQDISLGRKQRSGRLQRDRKDEHRRVIVERIVRADCPPGYFPV
jgi:hypothetical protein